ncbi:MAG: hypothetical protein KC800_28750 [Candidatus Eremiobacteraeota bacterium]|nr:hypothetical protein [Candidatus Eremiobacteraeota bacterium]
MRTTQAMSEEIADKDNDESDEGLNPEEAIEFLRLVEQARAETSPENEPIVEAPPEVEKPKKRFRLKSKGKRKDEKEAEGTEAPEQPAAKRVTDGEVRLAPDVVARAEAKAKKPDRPVKKVPPKQDEPARKRSRWLEGLLACAVLASVVHFAWSGTPAVGSDVRATPAVQPRLTQPDTAAVYFLRALYLGRSDEAYLFLATEKKAKLTSEGFNQLVGSYLEENRESLTRVEVDSMENDGSSAQLAIKTQTENLWMLELIRQEDSWYISSLRSDSLNL